mgnify:CR=1 FL=1
MKRLILYSATLLLTFVIGLYVNALVIRAAYHFIPDFDAQPTFHSDEKPTFPEGCGRNRHSVSHGASQR